MTSSLREAVRRAAKALAEAGIDSAESDAVSLAASALKTTTSEVHKLMVLGAPAPEGLDDLVAERARRVPLQHLTGKSGFRRLELSVGPGVFVPRFETELVAGLAITHLLLGKPRDGAAEPAANLGTVRSPVPRFAGGFAGGGSLHRVGGDRLGHQGRGPSR